MSRLKQRARTHVFESNSFYSQGSHAVRAMARTLLRLPQLDEAPLGTAIGFGAVLILVSHSLWACGALRPTTAGTVSHEIEISRVKCGVMIKLNRLTNARHIAFKCRIGTRNVSHQSNVITLSP